MAAGMAASVTLAACPGPKKPPEGPKGPQIPTDFVAPPALGGEPKPDASVLGHAWLDSIHPRFHERWAESFLEDCRIYLPPSNPLNDEKLLAVVTFDVAADGKVGDVRIAQPSGNQDFDQTALEVVTESAPFPAPPHEILSDDDKAHVSWRFARDVRQDGLAGAAVERRQWEPARSVPKLIAEGRLGEAADRIAAAAEKGADATLIKLARDVAGATLETALAGEEADVRVAAAKAIGAARWTGVTARLRLLATEAPDLRLQKAAIVALGQLGDTEAEAVLIKTVEGLDGDRSAAAAAALIALGKGSIVWDRAGAKIRDKDARVRTAALATVADLGLADSVEPLSALLADKKATRQDRAAAAHALGPSVGTDAASPAAKALLAALADGDATIRAAAVQSLAVAGARGLQSRAIYFKVEPLLKDRDPRVRAGAAIASARMAPAAAVEEVVILSRKDQDASVLAACAEALAAIPGPDSLAALIKLSSSTTELVRLTALRALATRSESAARTALSSAVADPDARVRAIAIAAELDRTKLETALADDSPEVRAAALTTYVKILGTAPALPKIIKIVATGANASRVAVAQAFLSATSEPTAGR